MEEKRYQILDVKKNLDELKDEYSMARRSELVWVTSVAMGALILGMDLSANAVVFDMIKDNPVAVSFMPIYAVLAIAAGETFNIKKFIESVKAAREAKKNLKEFNNEVENSIEEVGAKSI